ncbi:MAG: hypothetical protein U5K28_05480 [Halobacteriales archaeon]|nr:hypothetical protein [Halobacteriales archaeon]
MGTLALDIETATPFDSTFDGSRTETLGWVAIALAYDSGDESPESTVFLRRGDWSDEHTADLFDRFLDWCDGRAIDTMLTYNGAAFDLLHLRNWARQVASADLSPDAPQRLEQLAEHHVDIALAAADTYATELRPSQSILPDFKAYQLADIDNKTIRYAAYELPSAYLTAAGIDSDFVQGKHVGMALGERYVEGVVAGLEGTKTHGELESLLVDYCYSDILDLFTLYERLGGATLKPEYTVPLAAIER